MPAYVTFREAVMPKDGFGFAMPLPGQRIAPAETLAVGASPANSTAAPRDCIATIETTETCRFEIGAAGEVSAASQPLTAARVFTDLFVRAGQIVSVRSL